MGNWFFCDYWPPINFDIDIKSINPDFLGVEIPSPERQYLLLMIILPNVIMKILSYWYYGYITARKGDPWWLYKKPVGICIEPVTQLARASFLMNLIHELATDSQPSPLQFLIYPSLENWWNKGLPLCLYPPLPIPGNFLFKFFSKLVSPMGFYYVWPPYKAPVSYSLEHVKWKVKLC